MTKTYFWIKLFADFFDQKEIKKLRKIAGGDTFTIIYFRLMLLSLNTKGELYWEEIEPSIAEELALDLGEKLDDVRATLSYLISVGLAEELSPNVILLNRMDEMVGTETDKARMMRELRARRKALGEAGNNVTTMLPDSDKCYPDIDGEEETEAEVRVKKSYPKKGRYSAIDSVDLSNL